MATDLTKLKPEDLAKFAALARKSTSAATTIAKVRKSSADMAKASKTLADIAKSNPEV